MSDNQCAQILATIEESKKEEVKKYFDENGFYKTILYVADSVWNEETKAECEIMLRKRDASSRLYQLVYVDFNVKEHFRQTDSHKLWVKKSYNRFKQFVPNMTEDDAEVHDRSKYFFVQAIGYTAKWVYEVEWGNPTWQKALVDHYKREPHHPEFCKGDPMTRKDLEESLIDMIACRWERELKGNENSSDYDIVDFQPKFLKRYVSEDFKFVSALIAKIKRTDLIKATTPESRRSEVLDVLDKHDFVSTICYLADEVWNEETKFKCEEALKKRDENSKFYKLIYTEFNAAEHYRQTDSHKEWIVHAYTRLKDFVPNMTEEHAKVHDMSKYNFLQTIGYTCKWVYGVDWQNPTWQKGLQDHYKRESHHPEFCKGQSMTRKDLEESLIDMVASRWERQLKGDHSVSNFELVNFDPVYLKRYIKDDFDDVTALIDKIKHSDNDKTRAECSS